MASLTVPGRRANSRRQVRGFLRLEIEKAKPRDWPFGASSFLEGGVHACEESYQRASKKQNPEVSRASGFLFPPVGALIRRTWPA